TAASTTPTTHAVRCPARSPGSPVSRVRRRGTRRRPMRSTPSDRDPYRPAISTIRTALSRRRTSTSLCSRAACSTASSRGSTSRTSRSTRPTPCWPPYPPSDARRCSPDRTATATGSTSSCRGRGRPSSSRCSRGRVTSMTLLGALFGDPAVDELLEDDALVASMVETEIALLRALERRGIIPHGVADRADAAFAEHRFDPDALAAASTGGGNPVVPLVKAMLSVAPQDVRPWLHHGATSQDVCDTAVMLRSARVIDVVVSALGAARDAAAVLADRHRSTRQIARTLGQHAVPTTFGVVAAGWAVGLDAARRDLLRVRAE